MKNIFCFDQLVQNNRKYLDDCATKQSSYHSLFTVKYTSLTTITTDILPWDDMVCLLRLTLLEDVYEINITSVSRLELVTQ